ncbi:MAG: hypothetical protein R3303_01465 [Marinobacter sp.]|nr:hypothetical protein [Marinobacter sp.]
MAVSAVSVCRSLLFLCVLVPSSMLGLTACAVTPDSPLTVTPESDVSDVAARTFSTVVYPVPGRTGLLRRVEAVLIDHMQALGYRQRTAGGGDLRIELELQRTDPTPLFSQPVHSGRLILRLSQGDRTLRTGYTGSLSEIDLDFLSEPQIERRVQLFLNGFPEASPTGPDSPQAAPD